MYKQFNSKEESKKKSAFEVFREVIERFYPLNKKDPIYFEEIQLDETTVYQGHTKKNSYCIYSDPQPGRNFEHDPYIKIYNNTNKYKAKDLVRVSMKTGKVIKHDNVDKDAGKGDLTFDKEVCEFLIKALPKAYTGNHPTYPDSVVTVYDAIYYEIDEICKTKVTRHPIPDFKKANGLK